MAYWLSKRATAGGWFFIGLVGFIFLLLFVASTWGTAVPSRYTSDDFAVFLTIIVVMLTIAGWLLRRRHHIRRLLDEPLRTGTGRILNLQRAPYTGFRLTLQIRTPDGEVWETGLGYLGLPDWQIGDELALLFWENGRYCPRHINHIVDFGQLPTEKQRRKKHKRVIFFFIACFILAAFAILMGLYGQGRS